MSKAALYKKIVSVMQEVGQLQKDGDIKDNTGKKMYSYLSEEQTTGELQRAFVAHGLVLFPTKVESEIIYLESTKYDKEIKTPITKVIVTYRICDSETGESEDLQSIGYGSDSQDKGSNKAMTGAFKYVQRQTFMISTGDDGDHISSDELDKQHARPASPQRASQPERQRQQDNSSANADLAAIQQSSEQNRAGQGQSNNGAAIGRVYKLREKLNMSWADLNQFASNVLEREIKFLKSHVKTEEEWQQIENALKEAG